MRLLHNFDLTSRWTSLHIVSLIGKTKTFHHKLLCWFDCTGLQRQRLHLRYGPLRARLWGSPVDVPSSWRCLPPGARWSPGSWRLHGPCGPPCPSSDAAGTRSAGKHKRSMRLQRTRNFVLWMWLLCTHGAFERVDLAGVGLDLVSVLHGLWLGLAKGIVVLVHSLVQVRHLQQKHKQTQIDNKDQQLVMKPKNMDCLLYIITMLYLSCPFHTSYSHIRSQPHFVLDCSGFVSFSPNFAPHRFLLLFALSQCSLRYCSQTTFSSHLREWISPT